MKERLGQAWRRFVLAPLSSALKLERVIRTHGRRVRLDLRDRIIARTLYIYRDFEPELQRFISGLDLDGAVCVDVGANIGWHTLCLSEKAGHVFAFEPEEQNFRLLKANLQINGRNNVTALQAAASDHAGRSQIYLNKENFGDHRLVADGGRRTQEIYTETLDNVLRDVPDGALKFIKIDVQGHEMRVLRGMEATLARQPDLVLAIEVSPDLLPATGSSATELVQWLYNKGFSGWELCVHRVTPAAPAWAYDLIRDGQWADLILSRNPELLRVAMSRYTSAELPFA